MYHRTILKLCLNVLLKVKVWLFTSCSTVRATLGQVLGIETCWSQTHTEVTACD